MATTREIANNIALQVLPKIVYPNDTINNGVINDYYEPVAQIPFILAFAKPHVNEYYDSSYSYETGRGAIPVPYSTDYYIGEVL